MACGRGHLRNRRAALLPGDASYTRCAVRMQRLEPFVALLLIRQRPTHTAGGGQHWALGAAVTALPSGVLAMVCEALMKLDPGERPGRQDDSSAMLAQARAALAQHKSENPSDDLEDQG